VEFANLFNTYRSVIMSGAELQSRAEPVLSPNSSRRYQPYPLHSIAKPCGLMTRAGGRPNSTTWPLVILSRSCYVDAGAVRELFAVGTAAREA
jgi:hypothetical protein